MDWKGVEVAIKITDFNFEVVYFKKDYLDTDTITDLFLIFNPTEHIFSISPVMCDDDCEKEGS